MAMTKDEFYYDSRDNETGIHAIKWIPEGQPVCILQIVHGMAEYIDRYDRFAQFMAEKGILVTGNDHLGHGKSNSHRKNNSHNTQQNDAKAGDVDGQFHPYGYFCRQDPATVVVRDVHRLKKLVQAQYPGVPYLIMGHSMGSFILRNYLCRYGSGIDGAIIMGTGMQPKGLLTFSKTLAKALSVIQGPRHMSGLIDKLAFGNYNKRIIHPVSANDWLSRDSVEVAKYNEDRLCGFTFTLNGFVTLFELIDRLTVKEYLEKMPKELPVRFVSGKEDPVGNYGKSVEQVYQSFQELGMKNVSLRLYEQDRHELINEMDREAVWDDLYAWVTETAAGGMT